MLRIKGKTLFVLTRGLCLKMVNSKRVLSGEKPFSPDDRAQKRLLSGERRVLPDRIDNRRSSGASEPVRLRSQQTYPSDAVVSLYCIVLVAKTHIARELRSLFCHITPKAAHQAS